MILFGLAKIYEISLTKEKKTDIIVGVYYEYMEDNNVDYIKHYFSEEDARNYNTPLPGVALKIIYANTSYKNPNNNPYRSAIKDTGRVCWDCFTEIYGDLMIGLDNKYEQFEKIDLGVYFPWE